MFPHPTRKTTLQGASYRRMPSGEDLSSAGRPYRGRFPFSGKWEGQPATASMLRITQASSPLCPEPRPLWTVTLRLPPGPWRDVRELVSPDAPLPLQ